MQHILNDRAHMTSFSATISVPVARFFPEIVNEDIGSWEYNITTLIESNFSSLEEKQVYSKCLYILDLAKNSNGTVQKAEKLIHAYDKYVVFTFGFSKLSDFLEFTKKVNESEIVD